MAARCLNVANNVSEEFTKYFTVRKYLHTKQGKVGS
jgi:hypothetical protein